ncbi:MAG: hypothetical protein ACLROI_07265 [Beduini sp.]|uniref:hypothetical protein n=1 Tax=Beduini sp. TaxID=1922300 RepID=UPI0011CAB770
MNKKSKNNLEQAVDFVEDNVIDPIANSDMAKKMGEYATDAKRMAKDGVEEASDGMMELGENVASMLDAFKNHQEVEKLQKDVKKGFDKLGKSARKVADDVKDIVD